MKNSIQLHRILAAPPERVFKAFSNPDARTKWLPPYGFAGKMHSMDFSEGGQYKMSFTNMTTGSSNSFGGTFTEIIANKKIKYTDRFDNPHMPGEMQVTITLEPVLCGTELKVTQEGIPAAIPVEFCYLGWQQSLAQLALLVEPNIPD